MNKKTIIIVAVLTLLAIVWVYLLGQRDNSSEIIKLYGQKGIIVEQKSALLVQELSIRNQIDEINIQIREIDVKLEKAINPTNTGFIKAWQPEASPSNQVDQYISGIKTESVSQSQQ